MQGLLSAVLVSSYDDLEGWEARVYSVYRLRFTAEGDRSEKRRWVAAERTGRNQTLGLLSQHFPDQGPLGRGSTPYSPWVLAAAPGFAGTTTC